ncbi:hypothetical protein QJS10_CPB15g01345 [Acorus calamus]|uniref:Uncharacterized protein n=1 Tax=Acorus calamus TaxID=4465 RepID=A0AAV9D5U0_ACOCL|nr:hypothetical protein QJS10_CPB15g01345 [Acorus calamus]
MSTPEDTKPTSNPQPASTTDVLSSFKVLSGAATATFNNQSDKVDKAQVADAAADILDSAEKYGNLDEKTAAGKYVNQAEDYLRKYEDSSKPAGTKTDAPPPPEAQAAEAAPPAGEAEKSGSDAGIGGKPPPSKDELLSSAKLLAEAARATLSHESQKVDKARVAGATADLLDAASHYGKLEEKSFGKYVEKADTYLHQYHSSHSTHHHHHQWGRQPLVFDPLERRRRNSFGGRLWGLLAAG